MSGINHLPIMITPFTFTSTANPILQGVANFLINIINSIYDKIVKTNTPTPVIVKQPNWATNPSDDSSDNVSGKLLPFIREQNANTIFRFVETDKNTDTSGPLVRSQSETSFTNFDYDVDKMRNIAFRLACLEPDMILTRGPSGAELNYFNEHLNAYKKNSDNPYIDKAEKNLKQAEALKEREKIKRTKPEPITTSIPQPKPKPTKLLKQKNNVITTVPKKPVKTVKIADHQLTAEQLLERLKTEKVVKKDMTIKTFKDFKGTLQDIVYSPHRVCPEIQYETWKYCVDLFSREITGVNNLWWVWNSKSQDKNDTLHKHHIEFANEFRHAFQAKAAEPSFLTRIFH